MWLLCSLSTSRTARDDRQRKHFFSIQNGTVSIRKWRKQLRGISWIKFLISVSLTRASVQNRRGCSEFGLRIRNT